jgi:hypothetical protein
MTQLEIVHMVLRSVCLRHICVTFDAEKVRIIAASYFLDEGEDGKLAIGVLLIGGGISRKRKFRSLLEVP